MSRRRPSRRNVLTSKKDKPMSKVPPFPGIDRTAETLAPLQPSANGQDYRPGEGPLPIPGQSPAAEMPEVEEGAAPDAPPAPEPPRPHVMLHYKAFFADKAPHENVIFLTDLVDIRSVQEYHNARQIISQNHAKDGNLLRVIIIGKMLFERA